MAADTRAKAPRTYAAIVEGGVSPPTIDEVFVMTKLIKVMAGYSLTIVNSYWLIGVCR